MTMLDRMRQHKGWLKWSLALVVLAFVVFYVPSFIDQDPSAAGVGTREAVAEIDGTVITAGDFRQRYLEQMQRFRTEAGGALSEELLRQLGIEQQILSQMIDERIALIEAQRQGIGVSDEELRQQILSFTWMKNDAGEFIGRENYEAMLLTATPPMSVRQFEDRLRNEMTVSKLRAALTDWMTVSDDEVAQEYRQRNERVRLELVALTPDRFSEDVSVTDAEIAAHFESHQAEYRVGEQRRIRYVMVDREREREQINVTFEEVQRFYDDNSGLYQTPERVHARHILFEIDGAGEDAEAAARQQAEDVLAQITGGADFAELARMHSDDEGSRDAGGDLGFFPREQMVPEFSAVAFSLAPGQMSGVVRSQFGFHIIEVIAKEAAATRALEDVRAEIEEQLMAQRTEAAVTERARQLEERTRGATADTLQAAAQALGLTVEESGLFQRDDPIPGIGVAPQAAATAFLLGEGEVSQAIATPPRGIAVFAVVERKDPYVPPLEDVEDRVRQDLVRQRAVELSRQRAAELAKALSSARDFTASAKAQGFDVQDSGLVARDSPLPGVGYSPAVDRVAFSLPAGSVSEPIVSGDTTVILRVAERQDVTPEQLERERESFRATLLSERRGRFFTSYMTQVRNDMEVRTYPDVVSRVVGE